MLRLTPTRLTSAGEHHPFSIIGRQPFIRADRKNKREVRSPSPAPRWQRENSVFHPWSSVA